MLTSLNPLVGTTQSNLTQEAPSNELGRNEFLQLLVANLVQVELAAVRVGQL